ncbi:inorganic phosphate transporter, partial [Streptomyces sp. NPDC056672]
VAALLLACSGAIWLASRRRPVDHTNVTDFDEDEAGILADGITAVTTSTTTAAGAGAAAAAAAGHDLSTTIPSPPGGSGEPARTATV